MVELKETIVEKLRCSVCDTYLSCSPVMLNHNGTSVCGRCKAPDAEFPAVRNKAYEELASFIAFPCRYRYEGCEKRLSWNRVRSHEEQCDFRCYECPARPTGCCKWIGINSKLLEHFRVDHPNLVLEHPYKLVPDLTLDGEQNFLMCVFGFLFLVQLKFSGSAGKLWCGVRYLGNSAYFTNFEYTLEIRNLKSIMQKTRPVSARDSIVLHRHNAIEVSTKTLLDFLGGYEHMTFRITIQEKGTICFKCKRDLKLAKVCCSGDEERYHCANCRADLEQLHQSLFNKTE